MHCLVTKFIIETTSHDQSFYILAGRHHALPGDKNVIIHTTSHDQCFYILAGRHHALAGDNFLSLTRPPAISVSIVWLDAIMRCPVTNFVTHTTSHDQCFYNLAGRHHALSSDKVHSSYDLSRSMFLYFSWAQ